MKILNDMELTVTRRRKGGSRASYMEVQDCYTTVLAAGKDEQTSFLIFGDPTDAVTQERSAIISMNKLELEHLFHLVKARLEELQQIEFDAL